MYNFDTLLTSKLLNIPHIVYKNKNNNIYNWSYYNKKNQLIRFNLYQNYPTLIDQNNNFSYEYKFSVYNETTTHYDFINFDLQDFLNNDLKYLEKTIEYKNDIDNLINILKNHIGNSTFYTRFELGWNFKLLNIKITINKYKSPSNKTIKLEVPDSKTSYVNAQQLINYIKKQQELFESYFKQLQLNKNTCKLANNYEAELTNDVSNLNLHDKTSINENFVSYSIYNYNINNNKLLYQEICEKYKNLFIIYPKERRIFIQSCISQNDKNYFTK